MFLVTKSGSDDQLANVGSQSEICGNLSSFQSTEVRMGYLIGGVQITFLHTLKNAAAGILSVRSAFCVTNPIYLCFIIYNMVPRMPRILETNSISCFPDLYVTRCN